MTNRLLTFQTFIPEIPQILPKGHHDFIAIRTNDGLPIEDAALVTAVEGRVAYQKDSRWAASAIFSRQLDPHPDKPGQFIVNPLEIERVFPLGNPVSNVSEVLSDPKLKASLGIGRVGHDYHRTSDNFFEIKRPEGGVLALRFEISVQGDIVFTEIKETPNVEPSIHTRHISGEPQQRFFTVADSQTYVRQL